ncbi:MAG: UDP-N-acetylmuramoyl-L-alanyl-D-glutamate--2,6-diaminopimelate ligase [Treponema sp.]
MAHKHYAKQLFSCITGIQPLDIRGNDVCITSLSYDSRTVKKGALFIALPGIHTDGAAYIEAAIQQGAVAVLYQQELNRYHPDICYVKVSDTRSAMAAVAACFFDHPSKDLIIIGVTGTEGKTSTVSFIYQLLRLAGEKAGFFSTVSYSFGDSVVPNPAHQTTPESITVQERLAGMRDNGCRYAVVEASSHGLSPRTARLLHVYFDVAVFMNVTQEHLEFHGTFEQYRFDKAHLFRALDAHDHRKTAGSVAPFGVVNSNDPSAAYFATATDAPVFGFSASPLPEPATSAYPNTLYASSIQETAAGLTFTAHETQSNAVPYRSNINVPLAGAFNVYNILAALLVVSRLTHRKLTAFIPLLKQLEPVTGRMCHVQTGQNFELIIDYAHTPSSFQLLLPPIAKRIQAQGGKVIAVFGSAGERDTVKRPEQGRIADRYADIIILTDEDPRGENSVALLEMIAAGCPDRKRDENLFIIPDRPAAIRKACRCAKAGDCVLLLGKGHENSIIYKDHTMPYDEYTEAKKTLAELASNH